jgi:hypothetical protein
MSMMSMMSMMNMNWERVTMYLVSIMFLMGLYFIVRYSFQISRRVVEGFDLGEIERNVEGGIERSVDVGVSAVEKAGGAIERGVGGVLGVGAGVLELNGDGNGIGIGNGGSGSVPPSHCPNLLIKKDNAYYLYNSKKANVPGVNPIRFNNLEEYTEFARWLKSQGVRCPILQLQQTYDTQGERTYRITQVPDPDNPNDLITASIPEQVSTEDLLHVRELDGVMVGSEHLRQIQSQTQFQMQAPITKLYDAGHDKGSMPAFDPHNQYVGLNTPLDHMFHMEERTQGLSDNPMDVNFGGAQYAKDVVASGAYKEDEVTNVYIP